MSAVFERPLGYIEYEDYLVLERASQYKHEYLDGVIYAVQGDGTRGMAGGSAAHADVIANVGFALRTRLAGSPCKVKMSDMRVRVEASAAGFYPDVLVHCEPVNDPIHTDELKSARLIVEILSPSTQRFDAHAKLSAYWRLPGLQQIVLVSSTEQAVWSCNRSSDEALWSPLTAVPRHSVLQLPALDLQIDWREIYDGAGIDD